MQVGTDPQEVLAVLDRDGLDAALRTIDRDAPHGRLASNLRALFVRAILQRYVASGAMHKDVSLYIYKAIKSDTVSLSSILTANVIKDLSWSDDQAWIDARKAHAKNLRNLLTEGF